MPEFFIVANSFAAPIVSDTSETYEGHIEVDGETYEIGQPRDGRVVR